MEQLWPEELPGKNGDSEGMDMVVPGAQDESEGRGFHPLWVAAGLVLAGLVAFLVVLFTEQG